jgi:5-methylcytosine-specific restriction endonuclease McrA
MKKSNRKSEYSQKLLDPRWQKKRLEILQRDDWRCQSCGEKEKTLHVHHTEYFHGCDPWDYPDILMITLCDHCHESEHDNELINLPTNLVEAITELKQKGFLMSDIEHVLWEIEATGSRKRFFKTPLGGNNA